MTNADAWTFLGLGFVVGLSLGIGLGIQICEWLRNAERAAIRKLIEREARHD